MTQVILLAISDLVSDQRVHRTATSLQNAGYKVLAVGRRIKSTPKKVERSYQIHLFRLPFRKGPLLYLSYNIWAFFYLAFKRFNVLQANDLDTLLSARLICWLKRKPIIYDSHEFFTELPELINRNRTQNIWHWLERKLVPGLKYCSTVSRGIAKEMENRYGIPFLVIRNLPQGKPLPTTYQPQLRTIIYQGALNIGRGVERLIASMQFISNSKLIIVGSGEIENELSDHCKKLKLDAKVSFMGRIPLNELHYITGKATIGVSLEEDMGLNYRFALPNKLFDYIQAGLPVLVSDLPEMKKIVEQYKIGATISSDCNAYALAEKLNSMLDNTRQLNIWHTNSLEVAKELVWEKEEPLLLELFSSALIIN